MRGYFREHSRRREYVIDFSKANLLSPREMEKAMFPVYDAGNGGSSIGKMSVKEFLEKFG
jgi:hypothetical protein